MQYLHYLDAIFRSRTFFVRFSFIGVTSFYITFYGSLFLDPFWRFASQTLFSPTSSGYQIVNDPIKHHITLRSFSLSQGGRRTCRQKYSPKKRSSLIVCIVIAILTTMFTGLCSFGLFSSPSLKKIIEGAEKGERMNGNVLISKRKLACDDLNSIFFRTKKVAFSVLGIM